MAYDEGDCPADPPEHHQFHASVTSHIDHANLISQHSDLPSGHHVIADAFSYAANIGLQWPLPAAIDPHSTECTPVDTSTNSTTTVVTAAQQGDPQGTGNTLPDFTPASTTCMMCSTQDSPQDTSDTEEEYFDVIQDDMDRSGTPDHNPIALGTAVKFSRESRKHYPESFAPEYRDEQIRASVAPKPLKPPTNTHPVVDTSQAAPPSEAPLLIHQPVASEPARPPSPRAGDKVTQPPRPKSFQAIRHEPEPWVDHSKAFAANAAPPSLWMVKAAPHGISPSSPQDLIAQYQRSLTPALSFYARDSSDPRAQVGLILNGKKVTEHATLHDWGFDCNLMDAEIARLHDVAIYPTSIRLATSNGVSTPLQGMTAPITVSYGGGRMRSEHPIASL